MQISKPLFTGILCLLVVPAAVYSKDPNEPTNRIYVRAEGDLSPYGMMGYFLRDKLNASDEGGDFEVDNSKGSFDALLELENSSHSLAIVQADVLYHYLNGGHPQFPVPKSRSKIRAIAKLFPEWLFIEVNEQSNILKLNNQPDPDPEKLIRNSTKARAGKLGSGSLVTAINLGRIIQPQWNGSLLGYEQGMNDDAIRFSVQSPASTNCPSVGGKFILPPRSLMLPLRSAFGSTYRLVEDDNLHNRLVQADCIVAEDPCVISVDAILVGSKNLSPATVDEILKVIHSLDRHQRSKQLPKRIAANEAVMANRVTANHLLHFTSFSDYSNLKDDQSRIADIPVAVHPHVRIRRTEDKRPDWDVLSPILIDIHSYSPIAFLGAFAVATIVSWWLIGLFVRMIAATLAMAIGVLRMRWNFQFDNPSSKVVQKWATLGLALLVAHLVLGTVVWISEYFVETLEPESELAVGGMFSATWQLIVMFVVGETPELRSELSILGIAALKGGWGVSTLIASVLAAQWVTNWAESMTEENHIVLVGWNRRGNKLVDELFNQNRRFAIVARRLDGEDDEGLSLLSRLDKHLFRHVEADLSETALNDVNASKATAVIILADQVAATRSGDLAADLWVAKSTKLVAETLAPQKISRPSRVNIFAEVQDSNNASLVQTQGACKAFCVDTFGTELLVHAAKDVGLISVFAELMITSDTNNEVYIESIPESWIGRQFCEFVGARYGASKTEGHGIAIGLVNSSDGVTNVNPPPSTKIRANDEVVIIKRNGASVATTNPPKSIARSPATKKPGNKKNRRKSNRKKRRRKGG